MTVIVQLNLDEETSTRFLALSSLRRHTPNELMNAALKDYLLREEAIELEKQDDEARWQLYMKNGGAISHETAREWLLSLSEGRVIECPAESV